VKARLGYARSMVAATVLILGAAPVASAQATRTPNPNAPRLVVGTLRSSDKKLSVQASEELRSRFNADIPFRMLTVISSADYKTVVEQSGYPYDEALSSGDLGSLAKLLRTDEYIEGTVEKTATGFIIHASLTLTRDAGLTQPLPPAEGDRLARVASALSKSLQDARKQIDHEKKCNMLGRDNKPAEAIAAARAGVAAYPQATIARLCELNVRAGFKQAPDSLIAVALEVLKHDPKSKVALAYAAQAYKDKGDQDQSTEMLVRLLATDPTNTRLVDDVVNALAASGKSELAKPIIAQAIKDNPGDVRLMKLGFLIYFASGDRANGILLGEEMVKIDTSLADSVYFAKMIGAYQSDSAYAKSAEVARHAVAKLPNVPIFWVVLGADLRRSGQLPQAAEAYRRWLAHDPKAPVRVELAKLYQEKAQLDSAFIVLREAKAAGEDGQSVGQQAFVIGMEFFKAGQAAAAKAATSQAAIEKAPPAEKAQANRAAAEDRRTVIDEFLKVVPWMAFADSAYTAAENKNSSGFFMAVAGFYVASFSQVEAQVARAADPKGPRACELARQSQQYIAISQDNVTRGGRANPQAVGQLMGPIASTMENAGKLVEAYCKP